MKFNPSILLTVLTFFLLSACTDQNEEPKNEKVDELEEFMIQVEKSVEDGEIKDWNESEQEFHQRMDQLKDNTEELSQDVKQRIDQLESRFQKVKQDVKSDIDEAAEKAEDNLNSQR